MNKEQALSEESIDSWIANHKDELVHDVISLIKIKSISKRENSDTPFGAGTAQALDCALKLAQGYGFDTLNHTYYGIASTKDFKKGKTIGLFTHLDVVPEGTGWTYEPYQGVVKDGFIIGRGSDDNIGQVIVALFAMRYLKEHQLVHNTLFQCYGMDEEVNMEDMDIYVQNNGSPDYALVPDGSFPVCYGEKGMMDIRFTKKLQKSNVVSLSAGTALNVVSPSADIVLCNCSFPEVKAQMSMYQRITVEEVAEGVKITAAGISKHASIPDDSLNALKVLLDALLATHLLDDSVVADFTCVRESMNDCHGVSVGAPYQDALSGKISHILGKASLVHDVFEINFDMRVPIRVDCNEVKDAMSKHFATFGFAQTHDHIFPSKYTDPSSDWVQELTRISNEVLHQDEQPYVVGGGTYARKFKNAVSFGTKIKGEKPLFAENKGNPHQCDECVSIHSLLQGIKIYVKSIVYLDEKLGYEE